MKKYTSFVLILVLILGCKKPFSPMQETALATPLHYKKPLQTVVFIAGFDEGDNQYYTNAKNYFKGKELTIVQGIYSLQEIIAWLNEKGAHQNYDEIHIVSHSNAWLGMSLKAAKNGERISLKALQHAQKANKIPSVKNGITHKTKVIFHSCGLGENVALLKALKNALSSEEIPNVYASSFFNVFGSKYAGHYLAKPYYVFYPTAESPGPRQLARELEATYPQTPINWHKAMKTRKEPGLGEAYSYKFNIPIDWEFSFDSPAVVPKLKTRDAIMDWIAETPEMAELIFELNIPIEKYRWKTKIQGNKLLIKGKTTALCVLAPILQQNDTNEYRKPGVEDRRLYQKL